MVTKNEWVQIHQWQYEDSEHRKCKHCLIEEWFNEDDGWTWVGSEDFMDCYRHCYYKVIDGIYCI